MPKAIVIDPASTGATTARPAPRGTDTVIYETHVKGLTWTHPDVPADCAAPTPAWPTRR